MKVVHTKSEDRKLNFGEVYTPQKIVARMLATIRGGREDFWRDNNLTFFEPSCGNGNIVIAIVKKRVWALYEMAKKENMNRPDFYAISNTLENLWAIDINLENVKETKDRVLDYIINEFLVRVNRNKHIKEFIKEEAETIACFMCALNWQITQNEALSALVKNSDEAETAAKKTIMGAAFYKKHGHKFIDFNLTWTTYYKNNPSAIENFVSYIKEWCESEERKLNVGTQ